MVDSYVCPSKNSRYLSQGMGMRSFKNSKKLGRTECRVKVEIIKKMPRFGPICKARVLENLREDPIQVQE